VGQHDPVRGDADAAETDRWGQVSDSEFDRLLDELCDSPRLPTLPVDFSRADIHSERRLTFRMTGGSA
jgi:hypothetical protein